MIFGSATKKDTVYPTMLPCDREVDDQPEDSGGAMFYRATSAAIESVPSSETRAYHHVGLIN